MSVGTLLILVIMAAATFLTLRNDGSFDRFSFSPERVLRDRQYERLLTAGFLHVDWIHFAMNAISLYSFGPVLEWTFGVVPLLLIFLGSVVGGNLLALYLHRNHVYCGVGASGGVCGVIFAALFLLPGMSVSMFMLPIGIPSWVYAIGFLAYSYFGIRSQRDNIGHDAHFGGAVVGLALAFVMYPALVLQQPLLLGCVLSLSVVAVFALSRNPMVSAGRIFAWGDTPHKSNIRYQDYDHSKRRRTEEAHIDSILEKISLRGMSSLSPKEREKLEAYSATRRR